MHSVHGCHCHCVTFDKWLQWLFPSSSMAFWQLTIIIIVVYGLRNEINISKVSLLSSKTLTISSKRYWSECILRLSWWLDVATTKFYCLNLLTSGTEVPVFMVEGTVYPNLIDRWKDIGRMVMQYMIAEYGQLTNRAVIVGTWMQQHHR